MTSRELPDLISLRADVESLRAHLLLAEVRQADEIFAVAARHRASAINLVHYVELRAHDLRDLQTRLTNRGLTSLGRTESGVLASIDGLLRTLTLLIPQVGAVNPVYAPEAERPPHGSALLTHNAALLLGAQPSQRSTRIMVTLPSESATDAAMVQSMLESGMDLARINCAHDGPTGWAAMIANIHSAEAATGERCRVAMDLGGPKLRTGPITPGPEVIKVKPLRSPTGTVQKRGLAWLGTRPDNAVALGAPVIPIADSSWLGRRRVGDEIHLVDTREAHRTLTVEQIFSDGCLVSLPQTVYFGPGLALAGARDERDVVAFVGTLNPTEQFLLVHRGDTLILTADLSPADVTTDGTHRIGCTLPSAFQEARPGERVMLDDGKIGGVIVAVAPTEITVAVHHASLVGTKLRAEKGINLPDTHLSISALSEQDEADLHFVRAHADIVNMSFVRSADDVRDLLAHLEGNPELGVVLKIETVAAFEALPQILLEAMRWQNVGVMIARGDLAVEAGFERLAEVQEEILWLCEAAHVPVIWATQVLDTLARTGLPSRAEVTDAAMAERAECVMLNKGPFIAEAISMLAGILGRMQGHTDKKRSLLRRLRAWDLDTPSVAPVIDGSSRIR